MAQRNYAALPHEYLEEMQELDDAEFGRLCRALLTYSATGVMPELTGNERYLAARVRMQEDRYQNSGRIVGLFDSKRDSGRNTAEYRAWRKSVFERDNYTCQMCGRRDKKLNAHHIERYRNCIERRTDVENGITLCCDCHKLLHRLEGQ